jgi:ferredoxin
MRAEVDRGSCVGNAYCTIEAPEIFDLDDEGLAVAAPFDLPDRLMGAAKKAVLQCPMQAIRLL